MTDGTIEQVPVVTSHCAAVPSSVAGAAFRSHERQSRGRGPNQTFDQHILTRDGSHLPGVVSDSIGRLVIDVIVREPFEPYPDCERPGARPNRSGA
jgi:hypothetical protein